MSLFLFITTLKSLAQYSGVFYVAGDLDKFYPVIFQDLSWGNNKATEFEVGRSNVHTDASWRGSLIAKFRVHTTNYGHGSNFIDADIRQFSPYSGPMIGGWTDGTSSNGDQVVIIWFKGGTNHYYFNSPVNITPVVYDGVQNALPYQETNGPARSYKTGVDLYVNPNGLSGGGTAFFNGGGISYFGSNVGIGTYNPGNYQLAVAGNVHAQAVNVDMTGWSDFVFEPSYKLTSLADVKNYIDQNHHLPDVPSEEQVKKDGIDFGQMNSKLLKKIEELTLYLIDQNKYMLKQNKQILRLQKEVKQLKTEHHNSK